MALISQQRKIRPHITLSLTYPRVIVFTEQNCKMFCRPCNSHLASKIGENVNAHKTYCYSKIAGINSDVYSVIRIQSDAFFERSKYFESFHFSRKSKQMRQ